MYHAIVSAVDGRNTENCRTVREMIGYVAHHRSVSGHASHEEIMHEGSALRTVVDRHGGEENVVVQQLRTVRYLYLHVTRIVIQQVARHTCALCLPVKPKAENTVMNVIILNDRVNSGMELDAGNLRAAELVFVRYVVNVIMLYARKGAAHTGYFVGRNGERA